MVLFSAKQHKDNNIKQKQKKISKLLLQLRIVRLIFNVECSFIFLKLENK